MHGRFCHTVIQLVNSRLIELCHKERCDISTRKRYRKVPKFSDARKLCCNLLKIQEKRPNLRVFGQKDANEIANSEDPDQTDLGLHCLPRPICQKT